jgi:hypothetical protein
VHFGFEHGYTESCPVRRLRSTLRASPTSSTSASPPTALCTCWRLPTTGCCPSIRPAR